MLAQATPTALRRLSDGSPGCLDLYDYVMDIPQFIYSQMAKSAIDQFTRNQAVQLEPDGVRVNDAESKNGVSQSTPLQRPGLPEDIARTIDFLTIDDAVYITGQLIEVDGGLSIYSSRIATSSSDST
uniref:Uncharacterized protein n=1 Tax=Plectus sambesii TaxID=2011161 RepID=A0A914X5B4_9BILA